MAIKELILISVSCLLLGVSCSSRVQIQASQEIEALFTSPETPPEFLDISPEPGIVTSLSSNDNWGTYFQLPQGEVPTVEAVCIALDVVPLLRSGDRLESFDNVELSLNNSVIEQDTWTVTSGELAASLDGGRGPSSERVCWYLKDRFGVGYNRLDLRIWTSTNEEFNYTWVIKVNE